MSILRRHTHLDHETGHYEIRTHGRTAHSSPPTVISSKRDLLVWVLRTVGPRAMRDFVLEQLPEERLTTQQAADVLGMSRPSLIKILDEGEMQHTMVGNRRYVDLRSVEEYRRNGRSRLHAQFAPNPDRVVDEQLRTLQQLAEDEGDFDDV